MIGRSVVRRLASTRPAAWGAALLDRLASEPTCAVLTYHRIVDPATSPTIYPGLCVRPDELEWQLRALCRGREVISLADLLAVRRAEARLPRRSLLLTFDDAYIDFAEHAWPVLQAMSLPATLFVPTAFPDRDWRAFWWDRLFELVTYAAAQTKQLETPVGRFRIDSPERRLSAFRRLRDHAKTLRDRGADQLVAELESRIDAPAARGQVLGWDALRRLSADGLELAPHSRTHRLLPTLADEELRDELAASRTDLERATGHAPPAIAYPSGEHDARVVAVAREAGYEVAFTTRRGVIGPRPDEWLALPRINVGPAAHATLLRTQMAALPWVRPGHTPSRSVAPRQRGW
jgi:peptidoglycan/xylan/chitin deacetylase (PgdA/CDA1 family)